MFCLTLGTPSVLEPRPYCASEFQKNLSCDFALVQGFLGFTELKEQSTFTPSTTGD